MRALLAFVAALAAAAVLAPAAGAVPLVATSGGNIVQFDSESTGVTSSVTLTGLQPAETLVGLDVRPADGSIIGIGSTSRLYTINKATGATTQIGSAGAFTLSGTAFGMDFMPTADRIRVVSNADQNLRLNPATGALAGTDSALNPAGTIVAAAYTNSFPGAAATTLYDIDAVAGTLVMQGGPNGVPSPNGGALTTVGSLGLGTSLNENIGLDIASDGTAFATITVGGMSRLYTINLTTGAATPVPSIGGQIGTGSTAFLSVAATTITPPTIQLTSASASAAEGGTATLTVERTAPVSAPLTVDYSTAPGSAGSGEDFTPASGTLSWAAGEAGTKTIDVPIPPDAPAEGEETFTVTLTNPTGGATLGSPSVATVTIPANEAGPTLQFASGADVEEGKSATLQVTRVGSTASPVTVGYGTAPGSASENDYAPTSGTLSWAAGDGAPKTITVPTTDDASEEGEEAFGVALTNPTGGASIGTPSETEVTIGASDAPPPTLTLGGAKKQKLGKVRRKGVTIVATVDATCDLDGSVRRSGRKKRIGRPRGSLVAGKSRIGVKIKKKSARKLRRGQKLVVTATCANAAGKSKPAKRTIKLRR